MGAAHHPHILAMVHLGLTGGIACGKSLASKWFETHRVPIIDSDLVNRQLLDHDEHIQAAIRAQFGDSVFAKENHVDRTALRKIIFSDKQARSSLEAILHPVIRRKIQTWANAQANDSPAPHYCVIVVPLLFETGFDRLVEQSCVVDCPPETQLKRLMQRDSIDKPTALSVLNAQMPRKQRLRRADYVLNNDATTENLYQQLETLHLQLKSSAQGPDSR
jgi:dephospho-CoA kinase